MVEQRAFGRKKQAEERYMRAALEASTVFPAGTLISYEKPDFLLCSGEKSIGIEITELCCENSRKAHGQLTIVAERAHQDYGHQVGLRHVDVRAASSPNMADYKVDALAKGLAKFVAVNQDRDGSHNWNDDILPEGFCHIGIYKPFESTAKWQIVSAYHIPVASKSLVDNCIEKKNRLLHEYRKAAQEIWLLIVNDQFPGAGKVHVRLDDLGAWEFDSDFDKILLLSQEFGGDGRVVELRRRNRGQGRVGWRRP